MCSYEFKFNIMKYPIKIKTKEQKVAYRDMKKVLDDYDSVVNGTYPERQRELELEEKAKRLELTGSEISELSGIYQKNKQIRDRYFDVTMDYLKMKQSPFEKIMEKFVPNLMDVIKGVVIIEGVRMFLNIRSKINKK